MSSKTVWNTPPASGSITVTLWENPIYSQILVEDTGPGIRQEDLLHLFERFYRGQNAAPQSAGIGLALARMIITAQKRHHPGRQPPRRRRPLHPPLLQAKRTPRPITPSARRRHREPCPGAAAKDPPTR